MSERALARVVDEAAHWMMRLQSGAIDEQERQAFSAWQDADPQHAQVFQRLADNLGQVVRREPLRRLSDEQVLRALEAPSSRRAFLRGGLAVLGGLGIGALGLQLGRNGLILPGDLYTGTAQRATYTLADGSRLTLDARTRVAVDFDQRRELALHRGGILLEAPLGALPLSLETSVGRLSSPGGRLMLRGHEAGRLQLTLFDQALQLASGQILQPGQSVSLDRGGVLWQRPLNGEDGAWLDGLLEVEDRPLGEVVEALQAYRHGVLRVADGAAGLRTSGLYPLDDSDRALQLLAQTLPIRIRRYSDLWVSIDRA